MLGRHGNSPKSCYLWLDVQSWHEHQTFPRAPKCAGSHLLPPDLATQYQIRFQQIGLDESTNE